MTQPQNESSDNLLDDVLRVLKVVEDGEVLTYGDIAAALDLPDHAQPIGNVISNAENIESLAAPVVYSTMNAYLDWQTAKGKSSERAPWMDKRGIEYTIIDGMIKVSAKDRLSVDKIKSRLVA